MQDHYVSGAVSTLVMLAAIGMTVTTYSAYRDQVATTELEQTTAGMEQAATAMLSYKAQKVASAAVSTTTSTTTNVKATKVNAQ